MPIFSRTPVRLNRSSRQLEEAPEYPISDGQLLTRYVRSRDEDAFAELVRRHSGLVHAVCRRVLGDEHSADDAFQATFLVLARRAGSLDGERTLAGWLYAVAYRTALKARAQAARRHELEKQAPPMLATNPPPDQAWREFLPILDEELQRLPDKYRLPLILCYLEGKTHQQAARELKWPSGSMSRRMARALLLLRSRLQARGVALPGVLLLGLLGRSGDPMAPGHLLTDAIRSALAFQAGSTAGVADPVVALARAVLRSLGTRQWRLWQWLLICLSGVVLLVSGGAAAGMFTASGGLPGTIDACDRTPTTAAALPPQAAPANPANGGCGSAALPAAAPATGSICHSGPTANPAGGG